MLAPVEGRVVGIEEITDTFVTLDKSQTAVPDAKATAVYAGLQSLQDELGQVLRPAFAKHRALLA